MPGALRAPGILFSSLMVTYVVRVGTSVPATFACGGFSGQALAIHSKDCPEVRVDVLNLSGACDLHTGDDDRVLEIFQVQ